jgi:hypothetical protein
MATRCLADVRLDNATQHFRSCPITRLASDSVVWCRNRIKNKAPVECSPTDAFLFMTACGRLSPSLWSGQHPGTSDQFFGSDKHCVTPVTHCGIRHGPAEAPALLTVRGQINCFLYVEIEKSDAEPSPAKPEGSTPHLDW